MTLRRELILELHELPAHGHQGIRKTKKRVARTYYFLGLSTLVKDVVNNYNTCFRNKTAKHTPYGHLMNLSTLA